MSYIDQRRELKNSDKKPKEKKIYRLPKVGKKRKIENKSYLPASRAYRTEHPYCVIKSPVCTKWTQGVNHKKGRIGKLLMDKRYWEPACNPCNHYCESHPEWAIKNGHKISRHKKNNTMKKLILVIITLSVTCFCFSQNQKKLTAEDSALIEQQQVSRYIDSLIEKTSIKEMRDYLQSNISFKEYSELSFVTMYDFFIRSKVDLWIAQKQKSKKPPSKN